MTACPNCAHLLLGLCAAFTVAAAARTRAAEPARGDLEAVARHRIFFGHQSVGRNLLDGLEALAAREGVRLRVVEAGAGGVPAGTLAHAALERNGAPLEKLARFEEAFTSGRAAGAELAALKFCYVDVTEATDVDALFQAYRRTVAAVAAASPGTTLVHVTVPLQAVEGGVRGRLKRLLGRSPWGTSHNARREAFNDLLRGEYTGRAPLFDLAAVEATRPNGTVERSPWEGREVRALAPAWTDDGGHLGEEGRLHAARAFAAALADAGRARDRGDAGPAAGARRSAP